MDVCKCIVPLRQRGTLNSHRAACPLVRLIKGEEKWNASDHPQRFFLQNWGGTEPNPTVTCMILKSKVNDRRTTSPLPR
ncbi:uncharacterized protein TNCV_2669441 [Trichonephila clavipes]|nr:uncharacterized protein TNCV_2669441 [Trichonephila clavipes]